MKIQTLFTLASTLALAAVSAFTQANEQPVPYHYGKTMDVQKVIAMTEPQVTECQVINASIKFVDKAGEVHYVSYPKMSQACLFQS
ncbi:DUF2790 domain-containing protein [Pseudomonas sp. ERGC3:05]|nr:DUF2790 domain-containing protein [Pseudomonas sp. ERGC3:01]QZC93358.1 DUF2790 domain-containing protein [Pseudomonas sp. ERGC3:05]